MRYTVTSELDPELFAELERERRAAGLSRSAAIRQAIEWWVLQRKERGEERVERAEGRHRQVMRRLEYIAGMIRQQERAAKPVVERDGKHLGVASAGGLSEGSVERPGDGYAPRGGRDVRETESEGTEPRRSALAEARKRARRME